MLVADSKKREDALEGRLYEMKKILQSSRSDRNTLTWNLRAANVIYAILLINRHFAIISLYIVHAALSTAYVHPCYRA